MDTTLLTKKLGPIPVWGYMGGVLAAVLAWRLYSSKKTAATATDTSTTSASDATSASNIPEYIAQNYITNNIPAPVNSTTPTSPITTPTPPTLPAPPVSPQPPGKPVLPKPTPIVVAKKPIAVKVVKGDTLSSIAAKYKTTAAKLFAFNTSAASGRPASTIATLKKRGPNLLEVGETILVPQ